MLDLSSLTKALASLDRAMARSVSAPEDEELRDACIQRFEYSYELAWKMLKRRLEMDVPSPQEVDAMSYRTLIRVGAEMGFINDVSAWFLYRDQRNKTAHTYNEDTAREVYAVIPRFVIHAKHLLHRLEARNIHA